MVAARRVGVRPLQLRRAARRRRAAATSATGRSCRSIQSAGPGAPSGIDCGRERTGGPRRTARRRGGRRRQRHRRRAEPHRPRDARRRRRRRPARGGAAAAGPGRQHLVRAQRAVPRPARRAPGCPSRPGRCRAGRRCWSPPGSTGPRTERPGRPGRGHAALRPRPGPARPRALRPGRHRRPRAPLAADRREGLRAGAAEPLGQAQRRAEEADAHHRQRRRRPAQPADRGAARRGPDRHRPALALPAALRRRGAGRPGGGVRGRRHVPPDRARRPTTTCPTSTSTPTSSPRWSPT